jgi:galactonate dehydratase
VLVDFPEIDAGALGLLSTQKASIFPRIALNPSGVSGEMGNVASIAAAMVHTLENSVARMYRHQDVQRRQTRRAISRRTALQAGLAGLAGVALGSSLAPKSLAAMEADPRLNVKLVERTTLEMPFRDIPARNMDREIPHWRYTEVFEIHLASGHVGVGETLLYYTWGDSTDDQVNRVLHQNAARLMWDDDLGAGLQMALFDAVGRANDVPVHALLGRKVHEKTPLAWWNIDTSAEDMASECRTAYEQGYRSYKTKGRPWFDVWAQMDAVAKVVPHSFYVAMDFNDTLLDANRAIPILEDLAKYPQTAFYESPIFQSDIEGNQRIRQATRVPVAMHYGDPKPMVAFTQGVCDGFVVGGGASRLIKTGAACATADMPFWLQIVGTGLTAAWSLHFGGVLSHARWPAVNCHQLYAHTLLTRPIVVEEGNARVPDGPGLGYELDRAALERFRIEKPASRPEPERLIETTWSSGRKMYIANDGNVNFMLNAARAGKMPYFERGVNTRLVPNDGSAEWKSLYEKARTGLHFVG